MHTRTGRTGSFAGVLLLVFVQSCSSESRFTEPRRADMVGEEVTEPPRADVFGERISEIDNHASDEPLTDCVPTQRPPDVIDPTDRCIADLCATELSEDNHGDHDSNTCPADRPYLKDDVCVQCLNDNHCTEFGGSPYGDAPYCCVSNICGPFCGGCENPPCQYCFPPYSACVQLSGVWSCVQCVVDENCLDTQICDQSLYACVEPEGAGTPCTGCTHDEDCISYTGEIRECHVDSGCCVNPAGWCDGVEAMCTAGPCLGLIDVLFLGMGSPGMPGMGENGMPGACACFEPKDLGELQACSVTPCPSSECHGQAVCVPGDLVWMPEAQGLCISHTALKSILNR